MWVGRGRKARVAYGFDDIALVPGAVTVNPNEVDISWELCGHRFELPIIAAAMDGVVGPRLATEMGRHGGLAVLNLEGIFSRYANPAEVLERIVSASQEEATKIIQSIYGEPIKEELIHQRIGEIKKGGGPAVVSSIPQRAERFAQIAQEAGADIFVVQSTVTTARHIATEYTPVDLRKLKKQLAIPLVIGNVVTYEACLELMEVGADALLIGVGPGAACTSREVLGLGVPQVTATADAAAARDFYWKQSGPLRADHHRRRHDDGRRRLQGVRLRRRLGHDRIGVRAGDRSARPRLPLGDGDAAREPAARHTHPRRHRRLAGADPVRAGLHGRRHAQPGRSDPHLHGLGRRAQHPRAAADRADHRAHDQDRRKGLPAGSKTRAPAVAGRRCRPAPARSRSSISAVSTPS
jgi:IMP dehydrogenase family protein